MRRITPLRFALLAAALAIGQWLSLAHGFSHPALHGDLACQVCAHGQGLDGHALAPTLPSMTPLTASECPRAAAVAAPAVACLAERRIRGPPTALV